jgi:hypothetical protein
MGSVAILGNPETQAAEHAMYQHGKAGEEMFVIMFLSHRNASLLYI